MSDPTPVIGIDFGTSKSCMAWVNPRTGQAEIIHNAEGEPKTPSAVYFGEDRTLVGSPALDMLDEGEQERSRVVLSVKRNLVSAPTIALPGRRVRSLDVAAAILAKLKRDAEKGHFHEPVTRAVVTCPAMFDPLQRDKIKEAAALAGFAEIELVEEPVAAALAYERAGLAVGDRILVYDLGGGTFDIAVVARGDDGSYRLALPPRGLHQRGGDDLDRAIYDHADEAAQRLIHRPLSLAGQLDLAFLRECREAKEKLSTQERTTVTALLAAGDVLLPFRHPLDRATLEELIAEEYIEPTIKLTQSVLAEAAALGHAPDTVVLVGGSTQIPLVQRRLRDTLPVEPRQWHQRDVAVALGAAYSAAMRWGPLASAQPQEVVPAEPSASAGPAPAVVAAEATDVVAPAPTAIPLPAATPSPTPPVRRHPTNR